MIPSQRKRMSEKPPTAVGKGRRSRQSDKHRDRDGIFEQIFSNISSQDTGQCRRIISARLPRATLTVDSKPRTAVGGMSFFTRPNYGNRLSQKV